MAVPRPNMRPVYSGTGKNNITDEYNKIVFDLEHNLFHSKTDTTDLQLDKVGKHFFGKEWGGCFPEDQKIKLNPIQKYYIFNTDKASGAGVHWVAYPGRTVYIFDTFHRETSKLLPDLYVEIKHEHMKIKRGAHEIHQKD